MEPLAIALSDGFGVDGETQGFMTRLVLTPVLHHSDNELPRYYIPHIKAAFSPVSLPLAHKIKLFLGTSQTVKKLLYAFLFQEGTFDSDLLTSPRSNQLGALLQEPLNLKLGLPASLPNLGGNLAQGVGIVCSVLTF